MDESKHVMLKAQFLTLAFGLLALMSSAQMDVVIQWIDESGNPANQSDQTGSIIHVSSWLDGVTQATVQDEVLVFDSLGWCRWPQVENGVYDLESLPWTWTVVVEERPGVQVDTVALILPNEPIEGLRGNPAPVSYPKGHPGLTLAQLEQWLFVQLDSLDLDQLMATGAVGGNAAQKNQAAQNLARALTSSDSALVPLMTTPAFTLWGDLMEASIRSWRMSLGATTDGVALSEWMSARDNRSWHEHLRSPGWCAVWDLQHDAWWQDLEEDRRPWRSWVALGNVDSLRAVMGWSDNELHLAMWLGMDGSWGRWAQAWWDLRWTDECEVAQFRRQSERAKNYVLTSQAWGDERWLLPNDELATAWAGDGKWCVWLVTRSGSTAGLREWAILRNWMDTQGTKDMSWGILSVDDSEEGWSSTLAQRSNVRERLRWVGRSPSWWDRLDITGVPQIIVVRPDGAIQTHHAPLPSEGLFAQIKRWKLTSK